MPALAQQTSEPLEEVIVTGIRGSLTSSMNLKRDAQGVVDGIVAEDIGKFPDTNLAESLQRISGVSIDRSAIGEGQRVTVRGVGPDFNLVLLNGPADAGLSPRGHGPHPTIAPSTSPNLASEAIAGIEVYKTSRASTPTGGIGATINIKTARPLDNPGLHSSLGLKGMIDESGAEPAESPAGRRDHAGNLRHLQQYVRRRQVRRLPHASYQERNSGFNQAAVGNGWRAFAGDENNWGTIPQPGQPARRTSRTAPMRPTPIRCRRTSATASTASTQAHQRSARPAVASVEALTATLDYTYSENKIATQRNELSVWFNFGPSASSWTDGPVAGPLVYTESDPGANSDLSMGGAKFATKNENKSLGFNLAWEASSVSASSSTYHDSSAESGADSPYGSNAVLGVAAFVRGNTTGDFTHDFPVISVDLPAGMTGVSPSAMTVTGSAFRNGYMKMDIEQTQLGGNFDFSESSRLDFGVA
jgi:TonB-dependent receptor